MSVLLHGICAAKGIAMGRISVVDRGQLEVSEYLLDGDAVESEIARLFRAVELARQQLKDVRRRIPRGTTADIAAFIDTHLLMLKNSALTTVPASLIRQRRCNAEWALKIQRDELVSVFEEMDDPYLSTRKDDVDHVVTRVQRILLKHDRAPGEPLGSLLSGQVVVAHDLTPADVVLLQHQGVAGFITEYGGPTSHTAILARSLRMPSLVGLHQVRSYVKDDDRVIIDGRAGVLLVEPDERAVAYYRGLQERILHHHEARQRLRGAPARTADGNDIGLHANIELPTDVDAVKMVGADGIGLYRTEFLFMNRDTPPDEEEQYAAYAAVVRALDGAPVTIRSLDLGADKPGRYGTRAGALCPNPALGLRAVRLCLREPQLFYPQLRAILRTAALGPVRMMVPMISTLQEVAQVRQMLDSAARDLARQGVPFRRDIPLGAMVEVPAAALCADLFARRLDFLSIGTNDLIQYAMAIDRVDDEVNYLYDPLHPAVLRLVAATIQAGHDHAIPVSMCGEMAGNSRYTRLLLGMGLRELSVPPNVLLEIKQVIGETDSRELSAATARLMASDLPAERAELLAALNSMR